MKRLAIVICAAWMLAACAFLQSPAGQQVEKDLANAACVAAATESGVSQPEAIAQLCQMVLDDVLKNLAEQKKQRAMVRSKLAAARDAGAD